MKHLLFLSASIFCSTCFGSGEWVPVNQPQIIVQEQIVPHPIAVEPRPYVYYQLTPHVILEPIVTKRKRIFMQEETIQMVPVTRWVYSPVIIYR
jgi:hypothetical protein